MTYIYKHPGLDLYQEVEQSMNDEHVYFVDEVQWERVWNVPNLGFDMKIDPFSSKQFMQKTDKSGTYGDLLDRSKELSYMRAEKNSGVDPIAVAAEKKYSESRRGQKTQKNIKDINVEIKLKK